MSKINKNKVLVNPHYKKFDEFMADNWFEPIPWDMVYTPPNEKPVRDHFNDNLPWKPYCSNDLLRLLIRPKETALRHKYIQHNIPHKITFLAYDIDRETYSLDWFERGAPYPNIAVTNKKNGHAHLLYGLKVPVCTFSENPNVSLKAIRYVAAIDIAMTLLLEADKSYGKLICKTPFHESWKTEVWEEELYDLGTLASYLVLDDHRDVCKVLPAIGYGRNCTLFDIVRWWAYAEKMKEIYETQYELFCAVYEHAQGKNNLFDVPLHATEVKHICKSISRWTWKKFNKEGFSRWQSIQGKKGGLASGKVRLTKAEELYMAIQEYKKHNILARKRDIMAAFNVSEKTVYTALRYRFQKFDEDDNGMLDFY